MFPRLFTVSCEERRVQRRRSGSSASSWLYVQKNELLIRSSLGFAAHESFRKPGSLSDLHRLRAEKPGAGKDFYLPAQQTELGGCVCFCVCVCGEGYFFPND